MKERENHNPAVAAERSRMWCCEGPGCNGGRRAAATGSHEKSGRADAQ